MAGDAPSALNFSVESPFSGLLTWQNNDEYHYIAIWENKAGGGYGASPKAMIPGYKQSYALSGLDPDTNYCYKVLGGWWEPPAETDYSNEDCETTFAELEDPTGLEAIAFSNFVELTWKDNAGVEDNYCIYRRLSGGEWPAQGEPTAVVAANMEFFRDTTVAAGESYEYRVCARQGSDPYSYSGHSNVASVTANTLPGQAQNLQISEKQDTFLRLTWEAPAAGGYVTGYRIEISENEVDYEEIAVVDYDVFTYLVKNLTAETEYYFRVRAYNGVGYGEYSNVAGG